GAEQEGFAILQDDIPHQCPLFASTCNPQSAFGALMVSSEGACAAWYQYRSQENEV
ncbi:hypothetical protein ACP3UK_22665, partial [Klebsiella pneumoniae]